MVNCLQNYLQVKPLSWVCSLSLLTCLAWSPLSVSHAATTQPLVSKVNAKKGFASKPKKVYSAQKRHLQTSKAHKRAVVMAITPSYGQIAGLQGTQDNLKLRSSVALVVDQQTNEVLYSKNDNAVLPIASLTKLMTGLLLSESSLPMDESIMVTQDDVDTEKGSHSRLRVGSVLTRGELLHLALMSSENRAAHALARTTPGGLAAFVTQMNAKAKILGMQNTVYVEPTGLSSNNRSSAHDLVKLVDIAHQYPLLRQLSTSPGFRVAVGSSVLQYNNTNRLVKNPAWDIGLQKTGYISEAGQCLVMQANVAGRKLIMVFLDSAGKLSRIGDAERVRHWLESTSRVVSINNGLTFAAN